MDSGFIHDGHALAAFGTGASTRALALTMSFCAWYDAHAANFTQHIFHLMWIHQAGMKTS